MQTHLRHRLRAADDGLQYLKVIRTSSNRYWPNIYPIFIFRFILIINHHFVMLSRVTEHVSLSRLTTARLTLNVMTQNPTTFWQRHRIMFSLVFPSSLLVRARLWLVPAPWLIGSDEGEKQWNVLCSRDHWSQTWHCGKHNESLS